MEYVLVSGAMYVAYSADIQPSKVTGAFSNPDSFRPVHTSYFSYLSQVFFYRDIIGYIRLRDEMSKSLTASSV